MENLVGQMRCLFGLIENSACSYNPSNPPVYFSLGEAIGAFGLIFAVQCSPFRLLTLGT